MKHGRGMIWQGHQWEMKQHHTWEKRNYANVSSPKAHDMQTNYYTLVFTMCIFSQQPHHSSYTPPFQAVRGLASTGACASNSCTFSDKKCSFSNRKSQWGISLQIAGAIHLTFHIKDCEGKKKKKYLILLLVARLCRTWLFPWKATWISHGRNPNGTIQLYTHVYPSLSFFWST